MLSGKHKIILIIAFFIYALTVAMGLSHHELWGDEIHSWNIARNSNGLVELLTNIRYEGHPPVWYIFLWSVAKISHDAYAIQVLHFFITVSMGAVLLFLSPFPVFYRVLILSGYYFVYEYSVLSRNYAIGILMIFLLLWVQSREFRYKNVVYYCLLFLIANTHLLGCILAISIHAANLLGTRPFKWTIAHIAAFGMFLPTLYFIFPPSDSGIGLWRHNWELKQMLLFLHTPLKAFVPIPAWWEYHFWDSNFLLTYRNMNPVIRQLLIVFLSLLVLSMIFYLVRKNSKAFYLMVFIASLTFFVNLLLQMTSMRYAGYFYISFLCGLWIMYADHTTKWSRLQKNIILIVLLLQIPRGAYALYQDWKFPFSLSSEVVVMCKQIPPQSHVVSTYWAINNLSAFMDKSFYCLETRQNENFIKWNGNLKSFLVEENPYTHRINAYFKKYACKEIFLFATLNVEQLKRKDSLLFQFYNLQLVDKREGAIEPSGNQYLYRITPKLKHRTLEYPS